MFQLIDSIAKTFIGTNAYMAVSYGCLLNTFPLSFTSGMQILHLARASLYHCLCLYVSVYVCIYYIMDFY